MVPHYAFFSCTKSWSSDSIYSVTVCKLQKYRITKIVVVYETSEMKQDHNYKNLIENYENSEQLQQNRRRVIDAVSSFNNLY